jgi:hypothetical protein
MTAIANDAGLDLPSPNLELLASLNPQLWESLAAAGYRVAMPDMLGRSGADDVCWFIEVGQDKSRAYIYHLTEQRYLGNQFEVHGAPHETVAKARELLEGAAMQEGLSGIENRNVSAEVEHVYCAA